MNLFYEDSGICVATWNANGPVTTLYNVHGALPHTQVKHWDFGQKSYIKINRPNCITQCNKHMGEVE